MAVQTAVPASSANLGPGFDSIGLALGFWDECTVTIAEQPGLVIDVEGEGAAEVPRDESHLVWRSMVATWGWLDAPVPAGVNLFCRNGIRHGRGLGSSAAAIVTGVVAAQGLWAAAQGLDVAAVDRAVTNDIAAWLEGHPDNSSASVYGGMTLSWADDVAGEADAAGGGGAHPRTSTATVPLHPDLEAVALIPERTLSTATARSVLPPEVRLRDAAANSGRAALLVHAVSHDPSLLLPATREWLHQEPRRASYGGSMELVDRLRAAGHAAVISGAGPTVLVLTTPDAVEAVRALAPDGWGAKVPGVPTSGARVGQVG